MSKRSYTTIISVDQTSDEVFDATQHFAATASERTGREREEVWTSAVISAPRLIRFQKKAARTIPLLLLSQIS